MTAHPKSDVQGRAGKPCDPAGADLAEGTAIAVLRKVLDNATRVGKGRLHRLKLAGQGLTPGASLALELLERLDMRGDRRAKRRETAWSGDDRR